MSGVAMQTLILKTHRNGQLLDPTISMRLRAFRFVSERYMRRERPSFFAEFFLFVLIVITATWPMFSLVQALSLRK
jgi:hypothetical protein